MQTPAIYMTQDRDGAWLCWDCPTCGPYTRIGCEHYTTEPAFIPETKPSNPKDLIGSDKLPVSMVPATAIAYACLAHMEGTLKYGRANWRECGVRSSIYIDAMNRHMMKFADAGQWADPKTQVPHLASIIACAAIILDAHLMGKLIDDRPKPNPALAELIDKLGDNVKHLKELFKEHNPHHYLITEEQDVENLP